MIPTKIDREMSLNVPAPSKPAPMNRIEPTGKIPTIDVVMERTSVWLTARLTSSSKVLVRSSSSRSVFSRILSKTTTVSYNEYERINKKPMIAGGVTSKPTAPYIPTVSITTYMSPTMAAADIFQVRK